MNKPVHVSSDLNHFMQLPSKVRDEVLEWTGILDEVLEAKSIERGAREAAEKYGHMKGKSFDNIRRKARAYQKNGWYALINKSKLKRSNALLSIGEHFKEYCERNQRSCQDGWREMIGDLMRGKYFEDVGDWRQIFAQQNQDRAVPYNCPYSYSRPPKGWTYRNLMRVCGLTEYEKTASRIGRGKAREFLPSVYSTRVGLPVGSIYMFDDMQHDAKVNYPGNIHAQRPLEIAALDVASACRFTHIIKPRMEDYFTGKRRDLCDSDMRQLVAHVAINIGFHPAGCTFDVEMGTAAISIELEYILGTLSGGVGRIVVQGSKKNIEWTVQPLIRISRGGLINAPIHKGLYCGQPRGNYKRKAALESQHSLAHTVAAAIKGQIGRNRDNSPEQMYGLDQHNTQLIKAAAALPPERAALLVTPLLDFYTYNSVVAELYDKMNRRDWHDLEGWVECGYVETRYRLSPDSTEWFPMKEIAAKPMDEYRALYAAIQAMPEQLAETFKLSPQDVFDAGREQFVRLPKGCMPQILGPRLGVIKEIRDDGLITYSNQEFGPSEFRYLARDVITPDGYKINLQAGAKYMMHINPFAPDECFISEIEKDESGKPKPGSYIGLAKRWQTVCKTNVEALERMAGKQAAIEAELRAPIARRGAKEIQKKIEMHKNNAAVFSGEAITEDEQAELVRVRKSKTRLNDIYRTDTEDEIEDEDGPVERNQGPRLSDLYGNDS